MKKKNLWRRILKDSYGNDINKKEKIKIKIGVGGLLCALNKEQKAKKMLLIFYFFVTLKREDIWFKWECSKNYKIFVKTENKNNW